MTSDTPIAPKAPLKPKARTAHLEVVPIDDELHVLDVQTGVVHRLHPITAVVWHQADGTQTIEDLHRYVQDEIDPQAGEEAVWLALDALAEADLLEERMAPPTGTQRISRRDMIARVAAVGVGISSFMVSPLQAQSAPGGGESEQEQSSKAQSAKQAEKSSKEQGNKEQGNKEQGNKESSGKQR